MDFSITEEQTMLADSIGRFIDNDYSFEQRMKIAESNEAFSRDVWQNCVDLGWTAMLFADADGGYDGGPVEMMLMMEQFGRGLVVEPLLANVVLAGGVLKRSASREQKTRWLAGIIDGSRQAALAFAEPQSRYDIANIATTAKPNANGWVLDGGKALVLNGGAADLLIVPARLSGAQTDKNGISLFVVDANAAGVERKSYKTVDAHGAADITLNSVSVDTTALLGAEGEGFPVLADTINDGILAVCAEAVGIMRSMHDKTVEYAKQRIQFGVPIGSFQALQHRLVDTLMACEQARSLLLRAVMLSAADSPDASRAISELKYLIGTAGRKLAQEAVQIHGGMGVTWELDIAHYFKRMTAIGILFGDSDFHLDLVAASE